MANQHVVKRPNGWAVRRENANRDTSVHPTQDEAFQNARQIAQNQSGEVFVHDRKGLIRERNTYNKRDPFPPPG